jgi:hypothetical protein
MMLRKALSIGDLQSAAGLLLFSLALYAVLGPGRIDMIDGQWRFEVAYNMVLHGSIAVLDPGIRDWGLVGIDGQRYSFYGLSGSVVAVPWVAFAEWLAPGDRDLAQFMFSLTSPTLGAMTLALLFLCYRHMGFAVPAAIGWSLVLGFASLFLPLAVSVFDQAQNALFLLAAYVFTDIAREKKSPRYAVAGAIAFAILLNFKEAYVVLLPGLLWTSGCRRPADLRMLFRPRSIPAIVFAGAVSGLGFWIATNAIRFGSALPPAPPISTHPPILGNPLIGAAVVTISPGKGILWFSPVILVAAAGWARFSRSMTPLSQGVLIGAGAWLLLIASLSFSGGEWCWGPRYWVPVLPLIFLAAPYARLKSPGRRAALTILIAFSLTVQILGLAVDHQRFFFERQLQPFFWYRNEAFYFRESQLLARAQEIRTLRFHDAPGPTTITPFRPGPYPSSPTYAVFGPSERNSNSGAAWVGRYPVFSLPRPWPLWTPALGRPDVDTLRIWLLSLLAAISACGVLLVVAGFQRTSIRLLGINR